MPHNFARTSTLKDGGKTVERSSSSSAYHHDSNINNPRQTSKEGEMHARTSTAPRGDTATSSLFDIGNNSHHRSNHSPLPSPVNNQKAPQHQQHASLPAAVVAKLREAFHMNHESIDSFWGIHTLMAEQCGVHVTPDTLALLLCDIGVVAKGLLQESSRKNESNNNSNQKNASSIQVSALGEESDDIPKIMSTASKGGCSAASIEGIPVLLTEGDFLNLMARIATCTEYDTVFLDKDDKLLDEALFGEFFGGGEGGENNNLKESITSLGSGDQVRPLAGGGGGIAVKRTSILAGALPPLNNNTTSTTTTTTAAGNREDVNSPTTLATRSNISAARLEKFLSRFGISTSMELLSDKYKEIVTDQRRKREQALQNPLLNNNRRSTIRSSLISHGAFSIASEASKRKNSGLSLLSGGVENPDEVAADATVNGAPKPVKLVLHQAIPGQEGGAVDEEITLDALRSTILKGTAPVAAAVSSSSSPGAGKKARIREGAAVTIAATSDGGRRSLDPRGRSVLLPPLDGSQPSPGAHHQNRSQWRFEDFSPTAAAFAQSDITNKLVEQQQHVADGKTQGEMTNEEETAFLLVNGYLPGETANNATPNLLFSVASQEDRNNTMSSAMRRKFGSMKKKSMRRQPSTTSRASDGTIMNSSSTTAHHAHATSPSAAQMMLEHTFGASVAESDEGSSVDGGAQSEVGTAVTGQASTRGDMGSSDDEFSNDDSSLDSETAAVFYAVKQETMYADKVLKKLRSKQALKRGSGGDGGASGASNPLDEDGQSLSQSMGSKSFKLIRFHQQQQQQQPDHAASSTMEESAQPTTPGKQEDHQAVDASSSSSPPATTTYERRPKRQYGALTAHPSGGPTTETTNTSTTPAVTNLSIHTHMTGLEDDATITSSPLISQLQIENDPNVDDAQCSTIHDMTAPPSNHLTTNSGRQPTSPTPLRRGVSTDRQPGTTNVTQSQSGKLKKVYEKPWTMPKSQVLANEKCRKDKLLLERQKNRASAGYDGADEDELLQEFIRSGGVKSRQAVVTSPPPKHWKRTQQISSTEDGSESPEEMRKKWVSELKDFSTGELHELRPFVPLHIQQVIDGVLYARQEASLNDLLKGAQQQSDSAKGGVASASAASPERGGGGRSGGGLSTGLVVEDRPLIAPRITPNPFPKKIISKLDSRNPGAVKRASSTAIRPPASQSRAVDGSATPAPPMVVGVDPLITRWISSSRSGQ